MKKQATVLELLGEIKADVDNRISAQKSGKEHYQNASNLIGDAAFMIQREVKLMRYNDQEYTPAQNAKYKRDIEKRAVADLIKNPEYKNFPAITKKYLNELNKDLNGGLLQKVQSLFSSNKPKSNVVNWVKEEKQQEKEAKEIRKNRR